MQQTNDPGESPLLSFGLVDNGEENGLRIIDEKGLDVGGGERDGEEPPNVA